ncbi:MAG TPA: PIN domain-containing protein [Candidatus Angelobacter sp.]|nr:PIN domain-containing protein [Candidatus Angelobacter sp.]
MLSQKRKRPRGIVDTSVLVAGIAGLKKPQIKLKNASARLLRDWIEEDTFVWLVSEEILLEYKRVMASLGVRGPLIGRLINLLRQEAELIYASELPGVSPDPGDDYFCACAETGKADFIVTLNMKDFPPHRLSAHVIKPGETIPTTARRRIRRK